MSYFVAWHLLHCPGFDRDDPHCPPMPIAQMPFCPHCSLVAPIAQWLILPHHDFSSLPSPSPVWERIRIETRRKTTKKK